MVSSIYNTSGKTLILKVRKEAEKYTSEEGEV